MSKVQTDTIKQMYLCRTSVSGGHARIDTQTLIRI